jgi:hypothetical protein
MKPLIEDYIEIVYMTDEGDILSTQCNMVLGGPKSMSKVDGLSLIFNNLYGAALTPCLNTTETSLQFSENITHFAVYHIYTGVIRVGYCDYGIRQVR